MAAAGIDDDDISGPEPGRTRLDKWLVNARFFKTRALAAAVVSSGRLRLNGQPCRKPGHAVSAGDALSFPQAKVLRIIRITACAARRGPAAEARALYDDLAPAPDRP